MTGIPTHIKEYIDEWARARQRVRKCAAEARKAEQLWQEAVTYEFEAHRLMRKATAGRFQDEINNVE